MHPENPQAARLDSALDAYCAQARTVKRSGLAQATAYTAAAGAALALAPSADAAIAYTDPADIVMVANGTVPINLNNVTTVNLVDGVDDFVFAFNYTQSVTVHPTGIGGLGIVGSTGVAHLPLRLPSGAIVSNVDIPGGTVLNHGLLGIANWPGGSMSLAGAGFLGVAFKIGVGAQTNTHYGWIRLGIDTNSLGDPLAVTIYDWAYETTPDTAITTGTIPEPSPAAGLALLAAGAAGVATWRRRKQPAKA